MASTMSWNHLTSKLELEYHLLLVQKVSTRTQWYELASYILLDGLVVKVMSPLPSYKTWSGGVAPTLNKALHYSPVRFSMRDLAMLSFY
uniref:Uncharacterized protein n=1 Tax=Populus trichocarpa TaxID=3694 RepID=A0A2K2BWV9_POPTR